MGIKIDLVFGAGRQWLDFSEGINWLGFYAGCQNWLDFSVGDRKWREFSVGNPNWLEFSVGVWMTWSLLGWSKLTWFFVSRHQHWHRFRVGIESDLLSVLGSKLSLLCGGSKVTWFYSGDRNWLGFCSGSRNLLCFYERPENDLVLVYGRKLTWF